MPGRREAAVTRIERRQDAANRRQKRAQPHPAHQRLVVDAHAPGTVGKGFAQGDEAVSPEAGGNAGLGHHLAARCIAPLLRHQSLAVGQELAPVGDVVRPLHLAERRELPDHAIEFHSISRRHAHVHFAGKLAGDADADQRHGEAQVGDRHADVAARQGCAAPSEVHSVAGHHPQAEANGQRRAELERPGGDERRDDAEAQRGEPQEAGVLEQPRRRVLPARHGHQREEAREHQRQRHEYAVEVRRADGNLLPRGGLVDEWIERADQHRREGQHEQQVVRQQHELPGSPVVASPAARRRRPKAVQRERPADCQHQQPEDEQAALRVRREGMHGRDDAGADDEQAEQRQRKRRDGEEDRPALERAALLGDGEGMHQRRASQPRHEGCVLHRIPEPPAAPAEFVVGPPAAERDADREQGPGDVRPASGPARPRGV